MIQYNK